MIIKEACDRQESLLSLEQALSATGLSVDRRREIESRLRRQRAGLRAEKEAAFDIDFYNRKSLNRVVIHDVRFEHEGRVAQIDHLIITRFLEVYVLESKSASEGLAINEYGEFLAYQNGKAHGIPSPLEQNERHVAVLQDVFSSIGLPTRCGFVIQPQFIPLVVVSNAARITRPQSFDTRRVIHSDQLHSWMLRHWAASPPWVVLRLISRTTLIELAHRLVELHKPLDRGTSISLAA